MRRRDFISLVGAATVAAPAIVRAQVVRKMPTVGYLWHAGGAKEESPYYEALIEGFSRLGYVDGKNINLLHRFPNITGLSNFGREIAGKRLQLLKELVPGLKRVGLLTNPDLQTNRVYVEVMGEAARQLDLSLGTFDAHSVAEMEPAFDAMAKAGIQAMTPVQGGTSFQGRGIIPRLALARKIAMCAYSRETFEFGALVSYGPDQVEMCRRSAVFADKILNGAKPADLPIEQPSSFEFLINLKTAKALGLDVPLNQQQLANEVVE